MGPSGIIPLWASFFMLTFVKTGPPPPVESERNPLGLEDIPMTQITLPDADLAAALDGVSTDHFFTEEQFQRDMDYYRAQTIAKTMLDAGLISLSQFDKLTALNRRSFSPFLAEIMPKMT